MHFSTVNMMQEMKEKKRWGTESLKTEVGHKQPKKEYKLNFIKIETFGVSKVTIRKVKR